MDPRKVFAVDVAAFDHMDRMKAKAHHAPRDSHELEKAKAAYREGPRNRHEKRAEQAKLKKRMKTRAKNVHAAIRTGKAK